MSKFVEVSNQTFKLLFDNNDLDKMFVANVLSENDSFELIEGEILERKEIIQDEFAESERIASVLQAPFSSFANVKAQQLIQLNEFQLVRPSIVVSQLDFDRNPQIHGKDVFFAIELAKERYNYSDNPRAKYYGRCNFSEVWFIILNLGFIEVCTELNNGIRHCRTYRRGDVIKSETIPQLEIEVDKILGE